MKKRNYILTSLALFALIFGLVSADFSTEQSISPASVSTADVLDSRDSVELPVLMYHGITSDETQESEYFISTKRLEGDLIWLKDNGYTTVSPQQLIDYVEKGSHLPEKPLFLTFDDGYANNYYLALPILEKYGAKAVFSVIGSTADANSASINRPERSNLSWGEIALLSKSSSAFIGSHTYNLHSISGTGGRKGADMIPGESFEEYRKVLTEDLTLNNDLIEKATGTRPVVFAWPYGAYPADRSADEILTDLGFKISLTSYQISNTIEKGKPETLIGLRRYLRTPEFSLSEKLP